MHYTDLFPQLFQELGFDWHFRANCFAPQHDPDLGWPLQLPEVSEWRANTLVVLHFQDWLTVRNGRILELDQVAQHYHDHLDQVLVTHTIPALDQFYQGPVRLAPYCHYNYNVMTDLVNLRDQWLQIMQQPKTAQWQCLNGRICDHRRRVAGILREWPNGVLSLGNDIALPQWHYATYRGTENWENWMRLLPVYSASWFNIVTETVYDSPVGVISEKSCFAWAARQVPLIIGYRGIVQHCRDLGFDTFDDIVDNSYDHLPNEQRLEAALELNRDLILGGPIPGLDARLDQNQHHVLFGMRERIEQDFRQSITEIAAGWPTTLRYHHTA